MTLKVWAINPSRQRRGLARVVSCSFILRKNDIGTWQMTLDGNHFVSGYFDKGWRVVVYDDDTWLFSGPLTKIKRIVRGNSFILELEGETDMAYAGDRVAYPNTTWSPFSQGSLYSFARTAGPAENHIRDLANFQFGSSMPAGSNNPARTIPGWQTYTSLGRGATATLSARWTRVLDEIKMLANFGGLVVDIGQDADSTNIRMRIREAQNLAQRLRFTPKTGLGDHEVTLNAPKHNFVIVGGGGTGTARQVRAYELGSPGTWGRRREIFIDRRDLPSGTGSIEELDKAAYDSYLEGRETATCHFELFETELTKFGRDFKMGDIVTVQSPTGMTVMDEITSAEITYTAAARNVRLTIGETNPADETAPAWVQRMRDMERGMRRIQGAQ